MLVSAAADRSLRLWNVNAMQRLRALYKRPAEVTALAASRCAGLLPLLVPLLLVRCVWSGWNTYLSDAC